MPLTAFADEFGVTCTDEEMINMQSKIENLKITVDYMPEGTTAKINNAEIDLSNKFKISAANLPSDYTIKMYANSDKTGSFTVTNKLYTLIDKGGVYIVDIVNSKCGFGIIKSFEMMIPYFDNNNQSDVWFDGTYESNSGKNEPISKKAIDDKLLLALIISVAILIIIILLIVKKSKKKIKINILLILFAILCAFSCITSVNADTETNDAEFTIDSNGATKSGELGIPTDPIPSDGRAYLFTGVGFKISLVNVETMNTASELMVIIDNGPENAEKPGYRNVYCSNKNEDIVYWYCFIDAYASAYKTLTTVGVSGKISNGTYTTDFHKPDIIYEEGRVDDKNEAWFLTRANYNIPNVSQEAITNKLFTKNESTGKYTPTETYYEYLTALLKNGTVIEGIRNASDVTKILHDNKYAEKRQKLINYRLIVEPLYSSLTSLDNRVQEHYAYTVKSASLSGIILSDRAAFEGNFYSSNKHGRINSAPEDKVCNLRSATSGCGYIVYGIVGEKETKCNPYGDSNSNCCYVSSNGRNVEYKKSLSGAPFEGGYYCPSNKIDPNTKRCLGGAQMCVQQTTCADTKTSASCNATTGTKAVFHENDNLKTCALDSTTKSGFTIVSSEDTTPSSKSEGYCEVACKDDFDFEFPTKKFALSGTYFNLDEYTPKVSIKRTCVTSKISYATFKNDLDTARNNMIAAYNTWQDYKAYYNHTLKISLSEGYSDKYTWTTGGECIEWEPCKPKEGEKTCTGHGPCKKTTPIVPHECSYTSYAWLDLGYTATNGTTFTKIGGAEGTQAGVDCPSYPDSSSRAYLQKQAANNADKKYSSYISAKNKYENILAKYQKCSSWITEKTFGIDPSLKLVYNDLDSTVFNNKNLTHENTLEKDLTTDMTYWKENSTTNDNYTTGGDNTEDSEKIIYVQCTGTTCTNTLGTEITVLTSAYIKREESISYTYHLPTLYTAIPTGKVYTNKSSLKSYITLEEDAVPINVKTSKGTYNYTIQVSNLIDTVRKNAKNKNIDNFESRFTNSKVISGKGTNGNSYICDYKVENDIYNPSTGKNMFFYRPVEIADINPLGRTLGYNWTDSRAETVKSNMETTGNNYVELTQGSRDKFEFTLTPSVMKAIRTYNVTHDYGGSNLTCSNADTSNYHCTSAFLNCLASLSTLATSSNLCNNILEGRNLTNKTDYGYDELQANRNILIDKLMKLP